MEYIINELSLESQFENMTKFRDSLKNSTIKVINLVTEDNGTIYKSKNLGIKMVTENDTFNDVLKGRTDEARKFKSILLKSMLRDPYWEDNQVHSSEDLYLFENDVVTDTSMAEAYEREIPLISFNSDKSITLFSVENENGIKKDIINIVNVDDFKKHLFSIYKDTETLKYCKLKYHNTNLCFDYFEENYGFNQLEKYEIKVSLEYFDKFTEYSWEEIMKGKKPFHYKKYTPSSSNINWFETSKFKEKSIDKFRIAYTHDVSLRCFGFRENDIFYPLRIEKNHKISDHG